MENKKRDKKKIAILALLALLSAGAVGYSMKDQFKATKAPANEATTISVEKPETKEDVKVEAKVETKPEVKVEVKPAETKADEKPAVETKVETKEEVEVKEEVKPVIESKTESKTESKVETKSVQPTQTAKVETKVETKPVATKPVTTTTKPATQPVAKPAETKPAAPKPASPAPKPAVKQPVVTTKDETVNVPFTTERAYNIPGAQTRVKRQGVNGSITYRITYKDGVQVKREEVKRAAPVNQIVETYVKVQDRKVEKKEVEDKNKPIYRTVSMERVEVYYNLDPSLNFVIENLDADAARLIAEEEWLGRRPRGAANQDNLQKRFGHIGVTGWRDLQPRAVNTNEIIGYDYTIKEVVVQEELWAWK